MGGSVEGFASMMEDILDRLNKDLVFPARMEESQARSAGRSDSVARIQRMISVCEQMQVTIRQRLELATDATVDLAQEVIKLGNERQHAVEEANWWKAQSARARQEENEKPRGYVEHSKAEMINPQIEIRELRSRLAECKKELKQSRDDLRKLNMSRKPRAR